MSKAEELAQQYADASATWHVENLYGGSKSYTEECRKDKAAIGVDLFSELRRLAAENEALKAGAERYRWLRGRYLRVFSADDTGGVAFDIECQDIAINSESDGAALDAAIDSAMKEKPHG